MHELPPEQGSSDHFFDSATDHMGVPGSPLLVAGMDISDHLVGSGPQREAGAKNRRERGPWSRVSCSSAQLGFLARGPPRGEAEGRGD